MLKVVTLILLVLVVLLASAHAELQLDTNEDFDDFKIVHPNQPVNFQCKPKGVSGNAQWEITWSHGDRSAISEGSNIQISREQGLTIRKPTPAEAQKSYECTVTYGGASMSKKYNLVFVPTASIPEQTQVPEGGKLTLNCKVSGIPRPKVIWKFGDQSFSESTRRVFLSTSREGVNTQLLIQNMTSADFGRYTCKAENIAGFAIASTTVSVGEGGGGGGLGSDGLTGIVLAVIGGLAALAGGAFVCNKKRQEQPAGSVV